MGCVGKCNKIIKAYLLHNYNISSNCYLLFYQKTQENHEPINLIKITPETAQKCETIELQQSDLNLQKIPNKNLIFFKNYNEIINSKRKFKETKLKSLKFSKNLTDVKQQLKSNFNLLLEGHYEDVKCIAVTSDNKYVISGSGDKTIRI